MLLVWCCLTIGWASLLPAKSDVVWIELGFYEFRNKSKVDDSFERGVPEGAKLTASLMVRARVGQQFFCQAKVNNEIWQLTGVIKTADSTLVQLEEVEALYCKHLLPSESAGPKYSRTYSNGVPPLVWGKPRILTSASSGPAFEKTEVVTVNVSRQGPSPGFEP